MDNEKLTVKELLRYFSMGDIEFYEAYNPEKSDFRPNRLFICSTNALATGIKPYLNREVIYVQAIDKDKISITLEREEAE